MQAKKVQPKKAERHNAKPDLILEFANNMCCIICEISELANSEHEKTALLIPLGASGKDSGG
jgi:hypothetical protein